MRTIIFLSICCQCKVRYRQKEIDEDQCSDRLKSVAEVDGEVKSHGLCQDCLQITMNKIREKNYEAQ